MRNAATNTVGAPAWICTKPTLVLPTVTFASSANVNIVQKVNALVLLRKRLCPCCCVWLLTRVYPWPLWVPWKEASRDLWQTPPGAAGTVGVLSWAVSGLCLLPLSLCLWRLTSALSVISSVLFIPFPNSYACPDVCFLWGLLYQITPHHTRTHTHTFCWDLLGPGVLWACCTAITAGLLLASSLWVSVPVSRPFVIFCLHPSSAGAYLPVLSLGEKCFMMKWGLGRWQPQTVLCAWAQS